MQASQILRDPRANLGRVRTLGHARPALPASAGSESPSSSSGPAREPAATRRPRLARPTTTKRADRVGRVVRGRIRAAACCGFTQRRPFCAANATVHNSSRLSGGQVVEGSASGGRLAHSAASPSNTPPVVVNSGGGDIEMSGCSVQRAAKDETTLGRVNPVSTGVARAQGTCPITPRSKSESPGNPGPSSERVALHARPSPHVALTISPHHDEQLSPGDPKRSHSVNTVSDLTLRLTFARQGVRGGTDSTYVRPQRRKPGAGTGLPTGADELQCDPNSASRLPARQPRLTAPRTPQDGPKRGKFPGLT